MIALEQRRSEDIRTLGKIFFFMANEFDDITFRHSMQMLLEAMLASIGDKFNVSDTQMDVFMDDYIMRLPAYLQESLSKRDQ